jgi:acyl carrier protein
MFKNSKIPAIIIDFIKDESGLDGDNIVQSSTNLFDAGVLDSMMIIAVISFLEDTFDCILEIDELNMENFQSVDSISELVMKKKGPGTD